MTFDTSKGFEIYTVAVWQIDEDHTLDENNPPEIPGGTVLLVGDTEDTAARLAIDLYYTHRASNNVVTALSDRQFLERIGLNVRAYRVEDEANLKKFQTAADLLGYQTLIVA